MVDTLPFNFAREIAVHSEKIDVHNIKTLVWVFKNLLASCSLHSRASIVEETLILNVYLGL
jgi:hypothetical protein